MTIEEFANRLNGIGQAIQGTPGVLTNLGEQILNRMREDVPVVSGDLQKSLSYIVQGSTLEFTMLDYGQFQNFGVTAAGGPLVEPVPFGIDPQPLSPPFYAFQSREIGLPAQSWYDYEDIQEQITTALQNEINEI